MQIDLKYMGGRGVCWRNYFQCFIPNAFKVTPEGGSHFNIENYQKDEIVMQLTTS